MIVSVCADAPNRDGVDFPEFLVVLDIFRRALFDPEMAKSLRASFETAEHLQVEADLVAAQGKANSARKKKGRNVVDDFEAHINEYWGRVEEIIGQFRKSNEETVAGDQALGRLKEQLSSLCQQHGTLFGVH